MALKSVIGSVIEFFVFIKTNNNSNKYVLSLSFWAKSTLPLPQTWIRRPVLAELLRRTRGARSSLGEMSL